MTPTPPADSAAGRIGSALGGAALTGLAGWIAWLNLSRPDLDGWIFWVPLTLWLLTMSVLFWWSALSGDHTGSRAGLRSSWQGGWIVGALGLGVGFIGPLLLNPKANLGPLLGILITGPLGFVLGALGAGMLQALRKASA